MDELKKITMDDILDKQDVIIITIPDSKNGKKRVFTITDKMCNEVNPIVIYRKYSSLRPKQSPHKSFFIFYRNGRCSTQPVGIHTLSKIPCKIAEYLKLPNSKEYTGHALRRTSASLLADTGSDILTLKQHGGWKSSTVAEGYVETLLKKKKEISSRILLGTTAYNSNATVTNSKRSSSPIFNVTNNNNYSIVINSNKE